MSGVAETPIVRQCLKCWHIWDPKTWVRKDGTPRTKCPKCGAYSTLETRRSITKVYPREDLLMLTYGEYPRKYCPRTSVEEVVGVEVERKGKARLLIGRGFEPPWQGHKAVLTINRSVFMTTSYRERMGMRGAVAWCPPNAKVFIGGLGLGLVLLYLAKTNKAKEVVVCEISKDVIELITPRLEYWFSKHYPSFNWTVIQGDAVEEVLKGGPYDWIFMDIWQTPSLSEIEPVERIAKQNLSERGRVTCWMLSTLRRRKREKISLRFSFLKTTA